MRQINIEGHRRGDKFFVVLSADDGRSDEEEFETEEAARQAIERMIAKAKKDPRVTDIKYEENTRG